MLVCGERKRQSPPQTWGVGEGSAMRRTKSPTQGSPPIQEQSCLPESVQMPCFAGCPYKTPSIQPTNVYGAPTRCQAPCQAHWGTGCTEVYVPPLSSRRQSLERTQPQRLGEAQVQS